jgi:hypothetical protein
MQTKVSAQHEEAARQQEHIFNTNFPSKTIPG